MPVINVPDKGRTVRTTVCVSTGKGDEKVGDIVDADLPATLGDAVALYGEKAVFKRFIDSLVIALQGIERVRLQKEQAAARAPQHRRRGRHLDALGL